MAIKDWLSLVQKVGFDAARLSVSDLYVVSSSIRNDSVVKARRMGKVVGGKIPMGASAAVIDEMTETEREELRERIAN